MNEWKCVTCCRVLDLNAIIKHMTANQHGGFVRA